MATDIVCADDVKMYTDRIRHVATFPYLKLARIYAKGPFKRYVLAEQKAARSL